MRAHSRPALYGLARALLSSLPVCALIIGVFTAPVEAQAPSFQHGDLFVSVANGNVIWYRPSATSGFPIILNTGLGGFATGMTFDAVGNLYVTNFNANAVVKFENNSNPAGTPPVAFGKTYNRFPESILFDAAGNAYVGQPEGSRNILKLDPAGNLLARFNVATEVRGSDWIDLATSGCTIFYTSEGTHVLQFDASTGKQLANLPVTLGGTNAYALAIIPTTGDVLVADTDQIRRLDASNAYAVGQTYASGQKWFALSLDPRDPTVFWAGDQATGAISKFDIYSGAQLLSFNTAPASTFVSGLAVFPDLNNLPAPKGRGCPGAPPPRQTGPRMTGGGSVFTTSGTRVTHGFELHCNPLVGPNNLEVNWGSGNNFHLDSLTSATCNNDASLPPNPPAAGFNTYVGSGTGSYNGSPGYVANWVFTDQGEPGTNDIVKLTICVPGTDSADCVPGTLPPGSVLGVSGNLDKGNQQAHAN